ncbi:MAG: hypothetical protein M5U25_06505 [Planctomycetota bacterium]|nr:hypothetical protein [Planctomycetota bacterium]
MLNWLKSRVESNGPVWMLGTGIGIFLMLMAAFTAAGAALATIARVGSVLLSLAFLGLIIWLFTIPPHKRNFW